MPAAPLVTLEGVDVDLTGAPVLHRIDWQLRRGEHWGIVGGNGSGKSTLLGLIAGTVWPAPERGVRRYDFGDGPERDAVRARRAITVVGHELQDRFARLSWNFTTLDVVLSGVYRTDVPRRHPTSNERRQAEDVLRRLGVASLAERRFLELSRGEQRRILIARGVAFGPTVLLLDEPASGLDRAARTALEAMLELIARDCTIVGAAHTPAELPAVVGRYLELAQGRIVATQSRASRRERPTGSTPAARVAAAEPPSRAPLIVLRNVDVWLGDQHALRDLSWQLDPGEPWLVTGPNGSGKSSFLRLLHGQLRPALGGTIIWPGCGDPHNVWQLRKKVAWLSPELQAAYRYPSTVRACIASGFESSIGQTRPTTAAEGARVEQLLEELKLAPLADRLLSTLSYGQARRALIGRALANRPRVLLLDEPWEGLDDAMAKLLNRTLATIATQGTALVCASHLDAHREHFTHELRLEAGRATALGARST